MHGAHLTLEQLSLVSSRDASVKNKSRALALTANFFAGQKLDEWHGTINKAEDAREYAAKGWRKGADKALGFIADIYATCSIPEPKNVRRVQVWSDEGDDLDYDRLMSGELETMYRTTKREGKATSPHATLVVNWGGLSSVDADALFWSGAVAIILADVLENAGYRIEIVGCNVSTQDNGEVTATSVTVKELDEPLRSDVVAGTLCEAGVYRTLGFMAKCATNATVDSGMGRTADFNEYGIASMQESPFSEDVFAIKQCLNIDDAKKEIERVCNSLDEGNR